MNNDGSRSFKVLFQASNANAHRQMTLVIDADRTYCGLCHFLSLLVHSRKLHMNIWLLFWCLFVQIFRLPKICAHAVCALFCLGRKNCQIHLHWQLWSVLAIIHADVRDDIMIRYDCLILRVFENCFKYSIWSLARFQQCHVHHNHGIKSICLVVKSLILAIKEWKTKWKKNEKEIEERSLLKTKPKFFKHLSYKLRPAIAQRESIPSANRSEKDE